VWLVGAMALSLFAVNSVLVAIFSSLRFDRSFWAIWSENCVNALTMYLTGGVVAGIIHSALEQVNIFLFAAVVAFFGIVYLTFRRFVVDVQTTVEKAKEAERERAEEAEQHL